jgi:ribonuclease HI
LAIEGKIHTWENLQRKGWEGPSLCSLCKSSTEEINHLFISCYFTLSIWKRLKNILHLKDTWKGASIMDCYHHWKRYKSNIPFLLTLSCWFLWLERNATIFENTPPSHSWVFIKIMGALQWKSGIQKFPHTCSREFTYCDGFTVTCFDGASSTDGNLCGVGGFIKSHGTRVTRWIMNCVCGTNTKAELLGVWETLTIAHHLAYTKLQILGDSKVVIDWLNKRGKLQACAIEGWKVKVLGLLKMFQDISFQHIYMTHNIEADILSKKSFMEPEGRISFYSWENGIEGHREYISLS